MAAPPAPAAFPFVDVTISTAGLQARAERAPGVLAIVGVGGNQQTAENKPTVVGSAAEAKDLFGATGVLTSSLILALKQSPRPSKLYGVRVADGTPPAYPAGLSALEGADDVTFVALAGESTVGAAGERQRALMSHVENVSDAGNKRLGVAMVDPAITKAAVQNKTYAENIRDTYVNVKSTKGRIVLVAARGAIDTDTDKAGDVAAAAAAAMAGYEPHISPVLKPLTGLKIPVESQFGASEIKALSDENVIPVIDPALIPGESLHFAEARLFTTASDVFYVDVIRMLDQVEFELKAGLIGTVGDARITKAGMTTVKVRTEGILEGLLRRELIAAYAVQIPVLDILSVPDAARSQADKDMIAKARSTRVVVMLASITYGPAVHFLRVTLEPKYT